MEFNQILNKAVKGLSCCILRDPDDKPKCSECPYDGACANRLKQDALYLLQKQQKAQQPKQVFPIGYVGTSDSQYATCPWCFSRIHSNESQHYCGHCGKAVKWNA